MNTRVGLQVEAGDVLLKVNGTDVNRFTTREGKEFAIYHAHATYLRNILNTQITGNVIENVISSRM